MVFLYVWLGGIIALTLATIGGVKTVGNTGVPFYGILLAILLWPLIVPIAAFKK